ncbi:hypothetical protein TWF694_005814 [Orbilia ellipsospora]|uniref:Uncharacterized protein n=1 Tax=Orbilia ellipsospora TaxID=2528407 RepID=A0AAV9WS40_9PEZI
MLSRKKRRIQWTSILPLLFLNLGSTLPLNEVPLATPISTPGPKNSSPNPKYILKVSHQPRRPVAISLEPELESSIQVKPQPAPPSHYAPREGSLRVRCAPKTYVYSIPSHDVPGVIMADEWPDWHGEPWDSIQEALAEIAWRQRRCASNCKCSPEGRMIPRTPVYANPGCQTQQAADQCRVVFACFCSAEVGDEDMDASETGSIGVEAGRMKTGQALDDFKHDLEGIMVVDGSHSVSFSNGRVRVNDPSIKEPYFLEGPSKGENWDWFANLGNLSGGLGRIAKRDDLHQEKRSRNIRERI